MLRSWAVALGLWAALGAQAQQARPPVFVLNQSTSVVSPLSVAPKLLSWPVASSSVKIGSNRSRKLLKDCWASTLEVLSRASMELATEPVLSATQVIRRARERSSATTLMTVLISASTPASSATE